jgi:2-dehydropantoate 2-reductase
MTQKVNALLPEQMQGLYDIIFLMTKQQHNPEVVTFLKDYLAPDGVIVTLQNGLPEAGIADIVGPERVLGCTVAWGAPLNRKVTDLIHRIERGELAPGFDNLRYF